MSEMMNARTIDRSVRKGAEYINPVQLRKEIREFCAEHNLPWSEQRTERFNEAGEPIGPDHRISVEAATLMLEAGEQLECVFRRYLASLLPLPDPEPVKERADIRPCTVAACVEDEHEWVNGAPLNVCRLARHEGDGFIVHGNLLEDGWTAWVDADQLADAHEGIAQARGLVEAFEQMQTRCDALNGRSLETRVEPGNPSFEESP